MRTTLSRRAFSKSLTMVPLVAAGLYATRAAAADRKFTMSLACGPIGLKANLAESIDLAAKHGFESVEPKTNELVAMSAAKLDELKATLAAKKLQWGVTAVPADIRAATDADFEASLKDAPKVCAALQAVGATRVKTWIRPAHDSLTYLENFREHAARIKRIGEVVGDYGIRFGIEYVGPKTSWTAARHPFIHTMSEAMELLAATGRDNVGLVLDSWHWYCAEETAADLLKLTNNNVVSCDLNDAPAGIPVQEQIDQTRALPAATGVIDVKAFLNALVQIGYDGPVQAEPFDKSLREGTQEEAISRTAAAMKKAFALIG